MTEITTQVIQVVLQAVKGSRPPALSNPLVQLVSVQAQCQKYPTLPNGYRELYAIRELLTMLLLNVLGPERADYNEVQVRHHLAQDFKKGNPFIEAHSVLYHHYLRPDLGLNFQEMSRIIHVSSRTITRRKTEGLYHLLMALLDYEIQMRDINDK